MLRVDAREMNMYMNNFLHIKTKTSDFRVNRTLCRWAKEVLLNGDDVILLDTKGLPTAICYYEGTKLIEEPL